MCPSCRALVNAGDKTCSFCGVKLGRRPTGVGKLIQNILPHHAPVSYSILTTNFVFFLLIFYVDRDESVQDLQRLLLGQSSITLVSWGANVAWLVGQGQWWRLVSAIFMHVGVIHLLFNSYALLFIGPLLEERLGKERFLVLYLTTGALGFVLSNWYYPPWLTTAGASGSIFGMIGVAIVLSKRWSAWGSVLHQQLIHWAIYGLVYGLMLGANNAAHIGGFLSGVGLGLALPNPHRDMGSNRLLWKVLYWLCVTVIIVSLGLAIRFRLRA